MKKLNLIVLIFIAICTIVQAQNNEQTFSITIDSVTTEPSGNPQFLLCYTTIKNLSKEAIEFRGSSMYKKYQEERMWNLRIKKDGIICIWESKEEYFISLGNFTIKKGKSKKYRIPLALDEMVVFDFDPEGGVGTYTIQIDVSNVETKKVKKQMASSNIVEFQIKAPIVSYRQ